LIDGTNDARHRFRPLYINHRFDFLKNLRDLGDVGLWDALFPHDGNGIELFKHSPFRREVLNPRVGDVLKRTSERFETRN
jgi:hypothetical protein